LPGILSADIVFGQHNLIAVIKALESPASIKRAGNPIITKNLAKKHNRPCLHVDLNALSGYKAVEVIRSWIGARGMKILFVSGPRASRDPSIYEAVFNILKSAFYPPPQKIIIDQPNTVQEAVEQVISKLSEKEKTDIARTKDHEIPQLIVSLGAHIRHAFDSWFNSEKFIESFKSLNEEDGFNKEIASNIIAREIGLELRKTHSLRIVK